MLDWTDEQCKAAGLDPAKVLSLARRFRRLSREMAQMGLHVYGASGSGCLIHSSRPTHIDSFASQEYAIPDHGSVVANIGEGFDGGDW